MRFTTLIPAGLIAAVLAATGAAMATAQAAPDSGAADRPRMIEAGHRGHGHGHAGPRHGAMREIFDTVDANGDRQVTAEEIAAWRAAEVGSADASGDGALTLAEFETLYLSLTRGRMVDAFQALDADGDGSVTGAEMDRRVARVVERLDRDGDGVLTLRRPGADR